MPYPASDTIVIGSHFGFASPARLLNQGIQDYLHQHKLSWRLHALDGRPVDLAVPPWNQLSAVCGFISAHYWESHIAGHDIPCVSYFPRQAPQTSIVTVDDQAVGRLAAHYAYEHGYRSVTGFLSGLVGSAHTRIEACCSKAEELGLPAYRPALRGRGLSYQQRLDAHADVIATLPKPTLLFGHQDKQAHWLLEVCCALGLRVPEDVGVLGVDDNDRICCNCTPELSSIAVPWRMIGQEMARSLHRSLHGAQPENRILVPVRVSERGSTLAHSSGDELIDQAITCLKQHPQRPISQLAHDLAVDSSTLLRRCRFATGSTPKALQLQARLALACRLLSSGLAVAEVAARCGFRSRQRFGVAFRQRFGCTPSSWSSLANLDTRSPPDTVNPS